MNVTESFGGLLRSYAQVTHLLNDLRDEGRKPVSLTLRRTTRVVGAYLDALESIPEWEPRDLQIAYTLIKYSSRLQPRNVDAEAATKIEALRASRVDPAVRDHLIRELESLRDDEGITVGSWRQALGSIVSALGTTEARRAVFDLLTGLKNAAGLDEALDRVGRFARLRLAVLQPGVLTPILYCRRPDLLPIMNGPSRRGWRTLFGGELSSTWEDHDRFARGVDDLVRHAGLPVDRGAVDSLLYRYEETGESALREDVEWGEAMLRWGTDLAPLLEGYRRRPPPAALTTFEEAWDRFADVADVEAGTTPRFRLAFEEMLIHSAQEPSIPCRSDP